MVAVTTVYRIMVGKPERKSLLAIPRYKLKDNIQLDLKGIVWEDVGWVNPLKSNGYYMYQQLKNRQLCIFIYGSCMILTIISDYFLKRL
jgi:hypothetical protein